MNNAQRALLAATLLFAFVLPSDLNLRAQQQAVAPIRRRVVIVPAVQRCQPAEVKTLSFGPQPADSLLAQAMVENRSDKVISAVHLGWRVYDYPEGTRVNLAFCDPQAPSAVIRLAGVTQLIQLDRLGPQETATISINPTVLPTTATKIAFIDHPLLTAEDVKSLPLDPATPTLKYAIVVFVSEIEYADGTRWELKSN